MRLTFDGEARAFYVYVRDEDADVAMTKPIMQDELLVDYDKEGRLVGIEILGDPRYLAWVPKLLAQHDVPVPEHIHFDRLATAFEFAKAA